MSDKQPDYLFSKELREALAPFKGMSVTEAIASKDFMKALCKHAGMSDEKFEDILKDKKKEP